MINKKLFIFLISLVFSLLTIGGVNATSDNFTKLDSVLQNLSVNGTPTDDIIVAVLLIPGSDTLLDEIYNETKNISEEIKNISEEIKLEYRLLNSEFPYSEGTVLEQFGENESFTIEYNETMEDDYGLTREYLNSQNNISEELMKERIQIVNDILSQTYSGIQEQTKQEIETLPNTSVIKNRTIINSLWIKTKNKYLINLTEISEIVKVYHNPEGSYELSISPHIIGVGLWWSNGHYGGTNDVVVIDSGIDKSHPALSGHTFIEKAFPNTCTVNDTHGHGTGVVGIIASTDTTYKGLAFGLDKIYNAKLCPPAAWDRVEDAVEWALNQPDLPEVISLSSSWGTDRSGDSIATLYADSVVYFYRINWIKSAGNAGPSGPSITDPADGYNVIAVGAFDDKNTLTSTDDTIADFSSLGPAGTPGSETRIKPDLIAPGRLISTTNNNWEGSNPDFVEMSGTSFATVHVTGAILLLQSAGVTDSRDIRALLLNTAEDKGPAGPDNTHGYGWIDLRHAWYHKGDIISGTIQQNQTRFYKGTNLFSNDMATLIWNRYVVHDTAYNNYPSHYYNNLDLFGYNELNNNLIDSSAVEYDTREQVKFSTSYSSVVLKLKSEDVFTGQSQEKFSLATEENFQYANPPIIQATLLIPGSLTCDLTFNADVQVKNLGDIKAHGASVTLKLPSGFSIISGSNPQSLGTIDPGNFKTASWTVQASGSGIKTLSTDVTSSSYGETYTDSDSGNILIKECASNCSAPGYEYCISGTYGDCGVSIAMNVYSNVNNIQWGAVNDEYDPYVISQYKIGWKNVDAKKMYYGNGVNVTCQYGGCNSSQQIADTGTMVTVNAPGTASYQMLLGYDDTPSYWCSVWFNSFSPNYGPSDPVYVLKCFDDNDCSASYFCDKPGSWSTWDCVAKYSDGQSCTKDSQCQSNYCDNDGVGLVDDNWCFTPYNTYFDGQENTYCEYSTNYGIVNCDERQVGDDYTSCTTGGQTYFADQCSSVCQGEDRGDNTCRSSIFASGCTAAPNCNDKSPGTDLNTCNQAGQFYYEDECSNSCQYTDITSAFECTETGCSCSTSQCDGIVPQGNISFCDKGGETYFQDDCGLNATAEDVNNICRSANTLQQGDGCTAVPVCNGVAAGTGGCTADCQATDSPDITTPEITPVPAYSNESLNCSTIPTDSEKTQLNVSFTWFKNGGANHTFDSTVETTNNTLTSTDTPVVGLTNGEAWICSARAFDGEAYSDWKNSTPVEIYSLSWWNSTWKYRKQATITNNNDSAAMTAGTTINITFNHSELASEGKSLTDGSDIRVLLGDTAELDFINFTPWNQPNTTLMVKLQSDILASSSNSNYYLYYTNDTENASSAPSNKKSIFEEFDAFDDESINTTIWDVGSVYTTETTLAGTDGILKIDPGASPGWGRYLVSLKTYTMPRIIIARHQSVTRDPGFTGGFGYAEFNNGSDWGLVSPKIIYGIVFQGDDDLMEAFKGQTTLADTPYTYGTFMWGKLDIDAGYNASFYYRSDTNDTWHFMISDNSLPDFGDGYVRFDNTKYAYYVDEVWIIKSMRPHPTITLGVEETRVPVITIEFVFPTPTNGTTLPENTIPINVSASDLGDFSAFIDFNKSLVGWWSFENVSAEGIAYDHSTHSNDGAMVNFITNTTVSGKRGKALDFSGSNASVDAGNSTSVDITREITIEAWIFITFNNTDQKIAARQDDVAGGYKMGIYADDTHLPKLEMEVRNSTNNACLNRDVSGGTELLEGVWYHAVGVYRESDGFLATYVNGNLDRQMTSECVLSSTTGPLFIGREPFDDSLYFNGTMDEVRVWDRVLNETEIKASYQAGIYKLYNNFTGLPDGAYTFRAHAIDEQGNTNQTEERSVTVAVPPTITNFTVIYTNSTQRIFCFVINNFGSSILTNLTWTIDTGETNKTSNYNDTLQPSENVFVYVYYNYSTPGNYLATAYAYNESLFDFESINVTV